MYVVVDFETSGLDFWSPDFKVHSAAFCWRDNSGIVSWYSEDLEAIRRALVKLAHHEIVVHNASFEGGIFHYVFPDVPISIHIDTLRLVQLFDGGGMANALGLKDSAKRILGNEKGDWEKPAYDWIRANIPGAKKPGEHLSKVPTAILKEYNLKDVERTYELLEHILLRFEVAKYDWKQDMALYLFMVNKFMLAKAHGIPVDREPLAKYVDELTCKMLSIDDSFKQFFEIAVAEARAILHAKAQSMFKKKIVTDIPVFNPGSTRHLEYLFCEILKLSPRIQTPKGRPSFKTKYLAQWGEGGQILSGRAKAQFTKAQSLALLERSKGPDKRWHPDLSPGTTVTGRNKTYGGLNILALDRRDKGFMQTLLADSGQILVSIDLSAGEPSVVANFSKDPYYTWATVSGVGKEPYFDKHGVLMVDDIYLMFASQTPVGRAAIEKEFSAREWMTDPDAVKARLKKVRNLHKVAALGLSYTMGVKKLQKTFFENGYEYDEEVCHEIYNSYWRLFSGVKVFSDALGNAVQRNKYLLNYFGFRCYPTSARLAFNYFCQSTVNGLMAILTMAIEDCAPQARLITTIHDENIYSIEIGTEDVFRTQVLQAVSDMNTNLGWAVPIRTGFAIGRNFYEAK